MDLTTEITFPVRSPAYEEGQPIPKKYSCDGADISPPLAWGEPPAKTQSFVLIMDDPDAPDGTFTHWMAWDLPLQGRTLEEDAAVSALGGTEGTNDFGNIGYGGPCPPRGASHRYIVHMYALGKRLDLPSGSDRATLEKAMQGAVLANGTHMGTYIRST